MIKYICIPYINIYTHNITKLKPAGVNPCNSFIFPEGHGNSSDALSLFLSGLQENVASATRIHQAIQHPRTYIRI